MDCSKVIDFQKEVQRCCEYNTSNDLCGSDCPMWDKEKRYCALYAGDIFRFVKQEQIDRLQKWSDEHPEPKKKTYAKYFFERFPNAKKYKAGLPIVCREYVYGVRNEGCSFSTTTCYSCWNETLPDDFYDGSTNRDK